MKNLLKTHVEGFDDVLGGGIPRESVTLVTGEPGTMKTSFTYSVLNNAAAKKELNGLYITLEQKKESLESQMESMGFLTEDVGSWMTVMDIAGHRKRMTHNHGDLWLEYLKRCVERRKEVGCLDIVAIDSLDALEALSDFSDRRIVIHQLFEWLRDCDFTAFLVAESMPEFVVEDCEFVPQKNDAENLADGVILLKLKPVNDFEIQRLIRCVKMRSQNHDTSYYALIFEPGEFKVTKALHG